MKPNKSRRVTRTNKAKHNVAAKKEQQFSPEAQLIIVKHAQKEIDLYNEFDIYKTDELLKGINMMESNIILRLKKENFIKFLDESNPNNIQLDAYYRQIDARTRSTDPPKWVLTPFKYVDEGVIVAISPRVQAEYKELAEKYPELDIKIPEVGDTASIRADDAFWYKSHRYYPDKQRQAMDYVRDQEAMLLKQFDGYFRVSGFELESFVKNDGSRSVFYECDEAPEWYDEAQTYIDEMEALSDQLEKLQEEEQKKEDPSEMDMLQPGMDMPEKSIDTPDEY